MKREILGFLQLDFHVRRQYPAAISAQIVHALLVLMLFYFVSKSIGPVAAFGGEYFPFVAAGIAYAAFYQAHSSSAAGALRDWRSEGVLEWLLLAPRPRWQLFLGGGAPGALAGTLRALAILATVPWVFGASWTGAETDWALLVITLLLTAWLCQALALMGVASLWFWKRMNFVSLATSLGTTLLSGIYFPVSSLPAPVEQLALLIPFTHGVSLLRYALTGHGHAIAPEVSLLVLAVWTLVLTLCAIIFFRYAERALLRSGKITAF